MKHFSGRGFTLVELMVVITIISIFAVLGYTTYGSIQLKARDSRRIADMQETQKALEQYYQANHLYPHNTAGTSYSDKFINALSGVTDYFSDGSVPQDPNGQDYTYSAGGSGGTCTANISPTYYVCANLEDASNGANSLLHTDGCGNVSGTKTTYYCLSGQSQ